MCPKFPVLICSCHSLSCSNLFFLRPSHLMSPGLFSGALHCLVSFPVWHCPCFPAKLVLVTPRTFRPVLHMLLLSRPHSGEQTVLPQSLLCIKPGLWEPPCGCSTKGLWNTSVFYIFCIFIVPWWFTGFLWCFVQDIGQRKMYKFWFSDRLVVLTL